MTPQSFLANRFPIAVALFSIIRNVSGYGAAWLARSSGDERSQVQILLARPSDKAAVRDRLHGRWFLMTDFKSVLVRR